MINIMTQGCAFVMLFVIIYATISNKRLNMDKHHLFFLFLVNNMLGLILDVVSIHLIQSNPESMLTEIVCRLYLLTLVTMCVLLFSYTGYTIFAINDKNTELCNEKNTKIVKWYVKIITISAICVITIVPLYIHNENNEIYSYGPAPYATYAYAFVFIISTIYLLIRYKDITTKKYRNVIIFWITIWIIAALIQLCFPRLLIVSYAATLGILVMFLELENPKMLIDSETGLFNKDALNMYARFLKKKGIRYNMIIVHMANEELDAASQAILNKKVTDRMNASKDGYGFRDSDDDLVFLVEDTENLAEKVTNEIKKTLESNKPASKIAYTIIKDAGEKEYEKYSDEMTNKVPGIIKTVSNEEYEQLCKIETTKQMITDAIAENRVVIYLQPIWSNKRKKFTAAEVLTRIVDRNGNIIPPGSFIGVAESTGLIYELEEVIMDKTFEFLNQTDIKSLGLEYIEINLSIKNGENKSFVGRYDELADKYNVPTDCVNLEITETAVLSQKQHLLENMNALISRGVSFSLDDFGSGESNLNYVIDMPIEFLKFDMNITRAFFLNDKASIVMKAAVNMAHDLGLKTVAEGVETEDMLKQMQNIGVDYIQGFYFSKALPINEFIEFVREQNGID